MCVDRKWEGGPADVPCVHGQLSHFKTLTSDQYYNLCLYLAYSVELCGSTYHCHGITGFTREPVVVV